MRYSDVSVQSGQSHEAIDSAMAEASQQEIKQKGFEFEERKKFEGKAKKASKGIKKWGGWTGALAGIAAVGLGVAALPAAIIAGGATLIGSRIGMSKATGSGKALASMKHGKWFQGDQQDVRDNINKSIMSSAVTNAVMTGMTAGAARSGGVTPADLQVGSTSGVGAANIGGTPLATTVVKPGAAGGASSVTSGYTPLVGPEGAYSLTGKEVGKQSMFVSKSEGLIAKSSKAFAEQGIGKGTLQGVGFESAFKEQFWGNLKHAGGTLMGSGGAEIKNTLGYLQAGQSLMDWYQSDENKNKYQV